MLAVSLIEKESLSIGGYRISVAKIKADRVELRIFKGGSSQGSIRRSLKQGEKLNVSETTTVELVKIQNTTRGLKVIFEVDAPKDIRVDAPPGTPVSGRCDYVRPDSHGVFRVGDTRVMLDSVVAAFRQGHSPETIQQQYPALSLEEVYGSITYYLANASEVDAYLKRQDAEWDKARARAEAKPSAVVERLRALHKAGVSEAS